MRSPVPNNTPYSLCVIVLLTVLARPSHSASFDCSRASNPVEEMICTDPELSELDSQLNAKYNEHISLRDPPRAVLVWEQRGWLASRDRCTNRGCVKIHYVDRMSELTERGRSLQDIAPRLEVPSDARASNEGICPRLLDSLKRWQGVAVVSPTVAAQSVDAAEFRKEIGRCDPKQFVEHYAMEPRVLRENNLDLLSEEGRHAYGTGYRMHGDFRFYAVDIDNDAKNGDELVLYGAGVRSLDAEAGDRSAGFASFNVIDTDQCGLSSSAQVSDVLNDPDTFVGVLKSNGEYYVFDARRYPFESLWGLSIQRLAPSSAFFENICSFVAKDKHANAEDAIDSLHEAAKTDDVATIRRLVAGGLDVNAAKEGSSPCLLPRTGIGMRQ